MLLFFISMLQKRFNRLRFLLVSNTPMFFASVANIQDFLRKKKGLSYVEKNVEFARDNGLKLFCCDVRKK